MISPIPKIHLILEFQRGGIGHVEFSPCMPSSYTKSSIPSIGIITCAKLYSTCWLRFGRCKALILLEARAREASKQGRLVCHEPLSVDTPLSSLNSYPLICGPFILYSSYRTLLSQHGESAMLERIDLVHTIMATAIAFAQQCKSYN